MRKLYTIDEQFIKEVCDIDVPYLFSGIVVNECFKEYMLNGLWHRDNDLPAIVYSNNEANWWYHFGKQHRLNGPAVERLNGNNEYWIYNRFVTKEEHNLLRDIMKLKGLL